VTPIFGEDPITVIYCHTALIDNVTESIYAGAYAILVDNMIGAPVGNDGYVCVNN
jgi:hypothetical protein